MSNLRDQLLKAGLVSSKKARQAAHEERVHRKEAGKEGLEEERAAHEAELAAADEAKRLMDREREETRRLRAEEEARANALVQRLASGRLRDALGGNRRWYFVTDTGRITFLDLNDDAMRKLQQGAAAIVATEGVVRGEFCLVDTVTAGYLSKERPDVIRYWNRSARN